MDQSTRELGEVMLQEGMISAEQFNEALAWEQESGDPAWKVLLERGFVSERDLVCARALQIGIPFVDAANETPEPTAVELLPREAAERLVALPLRVENGNLVVAMGEPRNQLVINELTRLTEMPVIAAAAYRRDLRERIDAVYGRSVPPPSPDWMTPPGTESPWMGSGDAEMETNLPSPFAAADIPLVETNPVPAERNPEDDQLNLADLLDEVTSSGASDLHLTAGLPPMLRIDGELRPIEGQPKLMPRPLQTLIYSMLTQKQRETFEDNLELDLSYAIPGQARFRVNVFQQRSSLACVMRNIPVGIKTLDELGLPAAVKEFADMKRGLVLVTGITGSGKSTTLAALVDSINTRRHDHIITIEDPIEFLHKHKTSVVNQREVGGDTHSFQAALKHSLRQDPDVILVGEMRDLETIQTALTAAETGHLVFGTLHTQDAPQSVDRVIDVFPPHQQQQIRVQLASTLMGVVSQQLISKREGSGRAVATEVLFATPAVRNLIREGKTHQIYTSMQAGGAFGMRVMDQSLAELVKAGTITYETALEHCHHVEEFNRLTGRA
ncbi:MAG: twitching motility protein PilT [Actinomycetota bacterium]|jgi:twitching motility protein PilT|nr:twitching motility protein PilT [Actinomycetota bacterium]